MPRHLLLRVEGRRGEIPLESFSLVIKNTFDILTNLDSAVSAEPHGTLEWFISDLSYGSLLVTIEARPKTQFIDFSPKVLDSFIGGFEHLRQQRTIPPYFSDYDLKKTQGIANALRKGGASAVVVTDIESQHQAFIAPELSPSLSELMSVRYQEQGSIEGKLEVVSVHGPPKFTVYHALTQHAVRCKFEAATYIEKVKESLGRRVIVHGQVHFNYAHDPIRVDIEELNILPAEQELPSPNELRGLAPDFTGELSTEDYLRSLRSG